MPAAPTQQGPIDFSAINVQPTPSAQPTPATPTPASAPSVLSDGDRQKLDGIVQQMTTNGETDAYIQNVVDDFKQKYGQPVAPVTPPQPSLLDHITNAAKSFTDFLGLRGAVDTLSTNFANIMHPRLMAETNGPQTTLGENVGAGLQIGSIAAGAGATAPESIAANAALSGGLGAAQGSGKALADGSDASTALKEGALGGTIGAATGAATSVFGKLISSMGEKIQTSVIRPTKVDIEDGFNVDTIQKYNLGGSLSQMYDNTENKMNNLTNELNTKLASSNATVNLNTVFDDTAKSISTNQAKSFGSNTSIAGALSQLKDEVTTVANEDGTITVPQAQLVKQAAGRIGAWQYGAQDPDSTAREAVYNAFYKNLKIAIEKNSPDGVKDINKQLSELIPVANAIVRRIPVAERNNALSLQDMLTLTAGAINPKALVGFGISLAQKSGTVGNLLVKGGPKVSAAAPQIATGANALLNAVLPPATKSPTSQ